MPPTGMFVFGSLGHQTSGVGPIGSKGKMSRKAHLRRNAKHHYMNRGCLGISKKHNCEEVSDIPGRAVGLNGYLHEICVH